MPAWYPSNDQVFKEADCARRSKLAALLRNIGCESTNVGYGAWLAKDRRLSRPRMQATRQEAGCQRICERCGSAIRLVGVNPAGGGPATWIPPDGLRPEAADEAGADAGPFTSDETGAPASAKCVWATASCKSLHGGCGLTLGTLVRTRRWL